MKKVKKQCLVFVAIMMINTFTSIYAHDCHLFTTGSLKEYTKGPFDIISDSDPILKVIPKSGIHKALMNLKAQCCASGKISKINIDANISCKEDSVLWKGRSDYPESIFFFDHLLDVLLRRLEVDNDYESVIPKDKVAKERRDMINEFAEKKDGTLPPNFSNDYKKYRGLQTEYLIPYFTETSKTEYLNILKNNEKQHKILENIENRNLQTKYNNACQNIIYLIMKLPIEFDTKQIMIGQTRCKIMVDNVMNNEIQYLEKIIIHKSNKLLLDTLNQYGDEYYFKIKIQNFQKKLTALSSYFFGVYRQIPILQNKCN